MLITELGSSGRAKSAFKLRITKPSLQPRKHCFTLNEERGGLEDVRRIGGEETLFVVNVVIYGSKCGLK